MKRFFRLFSVKKSYGNNIVNVPRNKRHVIIIDGKNNNIQIDSESKISKLHIRIYGNNNTIKIGKASGNIRIKIGYKDERRTNNSIFECGNSDINEASFLLLEDNTSIKIGNDCMLSFALEFRCTDDHAILDKSNNVINLAKSIEIGNHVWIGKNATILKNTTIPDNCIVGYGSIVTKRFTTPNCLIAGIPAKIIKTDINWNASRPDKYTSPTISGK